MKLNRIITIFALFSLLFMVVQESSPVIAADWPCPPSGAWPAGCTPPSGNQPQPPSGAGQPCPPSGAWPAGCVPGGGGGTQPQPPSGAGQPCPPSGSWPAGCVPGGGGGNQPQPPSGAGQPCPPSGSWPAGCVPGGGGNQPQPPSGAGQPCPPSGSWPAGCVPGGGGGNQPQPPTSPPPSTDATEQSRGAGIYRVGTEVKIGKWRNNAPGSARCYWERLDGAGEINDNHFGSGGGTMNIRPGDFEVEFGRNCGTWTYVENEPRVLQPTATQSKGEGFYTVGIEIQAGRWRSTGSNSDTCYWARLDQFQDINDNHFGQAGGSILIQESDYEVEFDDDCGTWVYEG